MAELVVLNLKTLLGYTILFYEIYAEVKNRGLSPYMAFLHSEKNGHAALVSDLMEEWRALVVDSTVMSLVQGNEISISDFSTENNYIRMNKSALKIFIRKIQQKLQSKNKYLNDEMNTIRRQFYLQTVSIANAIENENCDLYSPVIIR